MKTRRTILIVDDHPIFRHGLAQLINQEHDLEVCGEAEDYHSALTCVERLAPDLVIVDITLKNMSGIAEKNVIHSFDTAWYTTTRLSATARSASR